MGLRRARISSADAEAFLSSLGALNIQLTDPVSYDGVFKLADVNGLTVYDASYLDLAIREGAQLASLDHALRQAAMKESILLFDVGQGA